MSHCDLCGTESARVSIVEDHWGLGTSTICQDATACASVWAPAFGTAPTGEPHEGEPLPESDALSVTRTAILYYGVTFDSGDKADPPTRMGGVTERLARV